MRISIPNWSDLQLYYVVAYETKRYEKDLDWQNLVPDTPFREFQKMVMCDKKCEDSLNDRTVLNDILTRTTLRELCKQLRLYQNAMRIRNGEISEGDEELQDEG